MKGAIFDMDGLMLDTERLNARIFVEEGQRAGYAFTMDTVAKIRGTSEAKSEQILRGVFGASFSYEALRTECLRRLREEMRRDGVPVKRGLRELLAYLKKEDCQIAVATSTNREDAAEFLGRADLLPYFDALVFGDMVQKSKPEPDIYLRAAELLHLSPRDCLALEDSPNGILSARRAGMKVIMVPDMDAATPEVERLLYACLPSLAEVCKMLRRRGIANV